MVLFYISTESVKAYYKEVKDDTIWPLHTVYEQQKEHNYGVWPRDTSYFMGDERTHQISCESPLHGLLVMSNHFYHSEITMDNKVSSSGMLRSVDLNIVLQAYKTSAYIFFVWLDV